MPNWCVQFALFPLYGQFYGMKTTLVLPDEVVREAKKRATEQGMTLSALVERSLRDALAESVGRGKRIVLPTFGHGLPRYEHTVAELKALEGEEPS